MKDEERSESTPHNSKAHLRLGKHKRKQRLKVQDIGSLPLPLDCRQLPMSSGAKAWLGALREVYVLFESPLGHAFLGSFHSCTVVIVINK